MKPSTTDTREFQAWLKNHKQEKEYNYKATSYYQTKTAEKNKKFFKTTSVLLIIAVGILMIISLL